MNTVFSVLTGFLLCWIVIIPVFPQSVQSFDIVSFSLASTWKKEAQQDWLAYRVENPAQKTYARILLYPSLPSSGNLETDFQAEWNDLVLNQYKPTQIINESLTDYKDGWKAKLRVASFVHHQVNQAVILLMLTDGKRKMSFVFLTNTEEFQKDFEDFGSSFKFQPASIKSSNSISQPANQAAPPNPIPPSSTSNQSPIFKPSNSASSGSTQPNYGVSTFPTRFDDGWNSVPQEDWVEVTKGDTKVLLHYGRNFDDAMRQDAVGINWNALIPSRYRVIQRQNYSYSTINFPFYYAEAEVTEIASGKAMYLGFLVVAVSGVAYVVEVQSPSKAHFTQVFPTVESIEKMREYNKFGLSLRDLSGTWQSFSSSSISLYNVYTGGNAGMNYASINDQFTFEPSGKYSSKHVGASSSYGTTSHFNDQFSGNASVSHWEMALSNRKDGRTDAYHAHFEAVKGGKILHMTHKQWSGLTFTLIQSR